MAEFRLRKREKLEQDPQAAVAVAPVPETPSLLGHVGSAVHTLGSLLSLPSRVFHGGINAATGGEGGFGNLNPLDATGGIEASQHLIRAGLLPANDPNKWEVHDVTRGLVDLAGDPTTWLTPLGLTKAGLGAAKAGTLAKGIGAQIRGGERALLTARVPFQGVVGELGTGADVADALATAGKVTRLAPAMKAIAGSKPVRVARGLFDAAMEGTTHPLLQKLMPGRFDALGKRKKEVDAVLMRIGRALKPFDDEAIARGDKMLPSEQIHSALEGVTQAPAHLQKYVDELKGLFNDRLAAEQRYGTGWNGPLSDPALKGYGPRFKSELPGDKLAGGSGSAKVVGRRGFLKGFYKGTHAEGGVNDVLSKLAKQAQDPALAGMSRRDKVNALADYLEQNHSADIIRKYATKAVVKKPVLINGRARVKIVPKVADRYKELARYAIDNPHLADAKLYGNHMLADVGRALHGSHLRGENARVVADALGEAAQAPGSGGRTLRDIFKGRKEKLKYRDAMVDQIGERIEARGVALPNRATDPDAWRAAVLDHTVDPDLVKQLQFAKPRRGATPAGESAANWWQQGLGLFKSGVLAFPASRVRDLVSGGVQNLLHGWGMGTGAYGDAARLMNGKLVAKDYSHVPAVQDWFKASGLDIANPVHNTRENQTEAIRQLVAVHLPREHGFLGDLPGGQAGFTLNDVLRNVPGQTPTTTMEQFVTGPLKTMATRDPQAWNPINVRGVGGRTETGFAPVKASERFAEASDVLNRGAGFLDQLHGGTNVDVAARNVNRAQIDYNPAGYSALEKTIKRNVAPFWSFQTRIIPETARQLADLGSPTSQLLKAQDRAYAGNPAVPDYVLDSAGIPTRRLPDGTLEYLTGGGAMHEPAAKFLGQAAQGDLKGLALNTLSQLNPFIQRPLEQATGVSLSRNGEPLSSLESNSGRLLSNLAVLAGLRDKDAGPVSFPGQKAADLIAGLTPVDRLLSTGRQLTDTRRGLGKLLTQEEPYEPGQVAWDIGPAGLMPAVSGLRITSLSPKKQMYELRKRAEEMAIEAGAHERKDVYFSREELDRLRQTNPELAAKQEKLQALVNGLKAGRKTTKSKTSSSEFRLRKREKAKAEA